MPKDISGASGRKPRAKTVIVIPTEGNRIYDDDVPLLWREAARQLGMGDTTFYRLLQQREISYLRIGRRLMVKPSAIREYLKRQERPAL